MDVLKTENLSLEYIICTHAHFDHVGALPEIKEQTGATVVIHKDEQEIYYGARDMAAFWDILLTRFPNLTSLQRMAMK